jgi:hypothetical protein
LKIFFPDFRVTNSSNLIFSLFEAVLKDKFQQWCLDIAAGHVFMYTDLLRHCPEYWILDKVNFFYRNSDHLFPHWLGQFEFRVPPALYKLAFPS